MCHQTWNDTLTQFNLILIFFCFYKNDNFSLIQFNPTINKNKRN